MITTTGTAIEVYLEWAKKEIEKKHYGEVSLTFTICNSQVTDVVKGSVDKDHYSLKGK